jgi:hypothetical protein
MTVEIEYILPDYKADEFTSLEIDVVEDCKGRSCLFFIKHGTHESYAYLPPERLVMLVEYYLYNISDGVYRVIDYGRAYGKEYPEGIGLDELLVRIKMLRG